MLQATTDTAAYCCQQAVASVWRRRVFVPRCCPWGSRRRPRKGHTKPLPAGEPQSTGSPAKKQPPQKGQFAQKQTPHLEIHLQEEPADLSDALATHYPKKHIPSNHAQPLLQYRTITAHARGPLQLLKAGSAASAHCKPAGAGGTAARHTPRIPAAVLRAWGTEPRAGSRAAPWSSPCSPVSGVGFRAALVPPCSKEEPCTHLTSVFTALQIQAREN